LIKEALVDRRSRLALLLIVTVVSTAAVAASQARSDSPLRSGARVFIHPMADGFDSYFKSALTAKKVPVVVVATRDEADLEIKGTSETQKAGAAKKIFMGSWHSDEQASISVTSVQSGEIVYAYSVNKKNSAHGKRSSAEACAKHLKEAIEKKK
jgi:hypothetical protein